jgi:hypothetical protein
MTNEEIIKISNDATDAAVNIMENMMTNTKEENALIAKLLQQLLDNNDRGATQR